MPDTTTTTAAPNTTTTTTAAPNTTTTAAAPWHGYTAPEDVAYVANKSWQGAPDVLKSYREAEKLIGRDPNTLLQVPRADDPAGLRAVFSKLGLPETGDKYEFAKPAEGLSLDPAYEKFARGAFHKIGLLPGQAKELTTEHNNYVAALQAQQAKDYELQVTTDKASLAREWGGGAERMFAAAKTAAKGLGFSAEMIDAIEHQVGYAGTWKFFATLGQRMGEPGFTTGSDKTNVFGNASLTPAEAKTQWEALKLDPNWKAAAMDPQHPGHKEAKQKQNNLFAVMYPNG